MADFDDYTSVTEVERLVGRLRGLLSARQSDEPVFFRGAAFALTRRDATDATFTHQLAGIPHFRHSEPLLRAFDLAGPFWLLQCAEKNRVVSEATGRLLLSALILAAPSVSLFVQIDDPTTHRYIGFRKGSDCAEAAVNDTIYYETARQETRTLPGESQLDCVLRTVKGNAATSAFIRLRWACGGVGIGYGERMEAPWGYCHGWCPIEEITIDAVWPRLQPEEPSVNQSQSCTASLDPLTAPIWIVARTVAAERDAPLRGSLARRLLASYAKTAFSDPDPTATLHAATVLMNVSIFSALGSSAEIDGYAARLENAESGPLDTRLFSCVGAVFGGEAAGMEREGIHGAGLLQRLRIERISEKLSLLWRRFVHRLETCWVQLAPIMQDSGVEGESDCEGHEPDYVGPHSGLGCKLALLDWCIVREREWQRTVTEYAATTEAIHPQHILPVPPVFAFVTHQGLDERLAAVRARLVAHSDESIADAPLSPLSPLPEHSGQLERLAHEHGTLFGDIWIPLSLNCEPPPVSLGVPMQPFAGETIARARLSADMCAFKAANPSHCDDTEMSFAAFLLWHSPKDVEIVDGAAVLSARMGEETGQWRQLWGEAVPEALSVRTFSRHVSFNHRGLFGQVLSDLALQYTIRELLEEAIPAIVRDMAGELQCLQDSQVDALLARDEGITRTAFPFDQLDPLLDAAEARLSMIHALATLAPAISEHAHDFGTPFVMVEEASRTSLLTHHPAAEFIVEREEFVVEGGDEAAAEVPPVQYTQHVRHYVAVENETLYHARAVRLPY